MKTPPNYMINSWFISAIIFIERGLPTGIIRNTFSSALEHMTGRCWRGLSLEAKAWWAVTRGKCCNPHVCGGNHRLVVCRVSLFFFFLRGDLSYLLIKWLLTTIKFCIGESMLNAQSLIHLKPNSRQSPVFWSITNKFLHGERILT